jgi:hypothetical protein
MSGAFKVPEAVTNRVPSGLPSQFECKLTGAQGAHQEATPRRSKGASV